MAGLLLSPPVPPAPVVLRLANLIFQGGPNRRMSGQKLVIAAGDRLSCSAERPSPETLPQGRVVLPLRPNMFRDPLGGRPGPGLGGHTRHM